MKKTYLVFMLFICASFLALPEAYAQDFFTLPINSVVGGNAPDFTLRDLSGKDVTLSSFQGKSVILNFWATWCPYCRQERPYLKSLHEKYKNNGLVVIAVSVDKSTTTLEKFIKQNPAPYIVLTDPEKMAAVPYSIRGLPTTYLIDRNGRIVHKFPGMVEWTDGEAKEYIDNLLEMK